MARGDHIFVKRLGGTYTHHGIDIGNDEVIHFTGEPGSKAHAAISKTTLQDFTLGCEIQVRQYGKGDVPDTVVQRARSRLGETGYNLVFNNCHSHPIEAQGAH